MKQDEALSILAAKNEKLEDILKTIKICAKPKLIIHYGCAYLTFKHNDNVIYYAIPNEKYNLIKEWLNNDN